MPGLTVPSGPLRLSVSRSSTTIVAKNVHGENGVETDHCRGLHTLVIGEEGAKIQATIVSLANDNLALNNQIAEAKAELAPHLYGLSTEAFLSLAELSDVNERIGRRVTAAEQQRKSKHCCCSINCRCHDSTPLLWVCF
jgi:hypothetical protein